MTRFLSQTYQSRWQDLILKRQTGFFYERAKNGDFTFVSPEVTDALGWSPEQFLNQWSSWAKSPSQETGGLHRLGQEMIQRELKIYRCKIPGKCGRLHWFEMVEQTLETSQETQSSVEGFARNISDQHHEEQASQSRENQFRQIMDFAPIGIFQTDADFKLTYANTYWQVITRCPLKKTLGSSWLTPVLKEDRERVVKEWKEKMKQSQECFTQCRILRPDGEIRWVEFRSRLLYQEGGRIIFGTIEDITAHREMEAQLQEHTEELKRSNLDLESFATIASHDLKEPLRKITAFGNLLKTSVLQKNEDQVLYFLERIQKAGTRMQGLIDDLLQLSRISIESRPFQPVDLDAVVTEVISDLELIINKSQAIIQFTPLPRLMADEAQMRQLFMNFLGNALKFTREGVPPKIRVNVERLENCDWVFSIEDNGIGFDIAHFERILKPFERLFGRGQYEGSGMGLAICDKIIARHKGSLSATSEPGKGTTFSFSIPNKI